MALFYNILTQSYLREPPAWFHTRILVGPGAYLTPAFVAKYNITHVVNCAFETDSPLWFQTKFPEKYACMRAVDSIAANILDWFPRFEQVVQSFLREGNGVVYVHCQAGMNRSAFLALTYVTKNFHTDLNYTLAATKRQRPCMYANPIYMKQVREFINGRVSRS